MSNTVAQPSFKTVDKDELYQCPYDPVHRVSAKRFATHLTKCRKVSKLLAYLQFIIDYLCRFYKFYFVYFYVYMIVFLLIIAFCVFL